MTEKVPKFMHARFEEITSLTDAVCQEYLNDEYAEMSRVLAAALARKRPSPLSGGRTSVWACGIVYSVGFVNFLFDKSFSPYLSAEDLCAAFGVAKSTGYNKSKEIRDLLNLTQFDPRWTLPSLMDDNPLAWMISVNGLIVDVRHAPRSIQEEAFRKGVIRYLPGKGESSPPHQGETTSKEPRPKNKHHQFGKLPPLYRFILNPYEDIRFSTCPACNQKTLLRKIPLAVHVGPHHPVMLNKHCRYCPECDLLICHQDELEHMLVLAFEKHAPEAIGNDYLVLGTFDKSAWRKREMEPILMADLPDYLHDFKEYLKLK